MKILMVNKFLYPKGGAETYVFRLGGYLETQGHKVQYFGMENAGRCVSNHAEAYISEMDFHGNFSLSKLIWPIKVIYSMEARKKIRRVLEDFQPDVVHLNNFSFQITPSIILEIEKWRKQKKKKCRIIFTAHDYNLICPNHMLYNPNTGMTCEKCIGGHYFNCIKGRCIHSSLARSITGAVEGWFWRARGVYRYIDRVICCSKFMKTKMDTNPLFRKKTVVLHNFSDQPQLKSVSQETKECSQSVGSGMKKGYVLYFGRFSIEKGIHTLLEVCRMLPEVHFIFAGSGPLEGELEGIPNIKNVGFKSGEELSKLIREADFSVYPSKWYENCPFSVIESQVYGTPVLGADIGGIPELIKNGETGELFESGNTRELKDKLWRLWENKELIRQYSKNCQNVRFETLEGYCEKLKKIYGFE